VARGGVRVEEKEHKSKNKKLKLITVVKKTV
jgi:hypothetical protein